MFVEHIGQKKSPALAGVSGDFSKSFQTKFTKPRPVLQLVTPTADTINQARYPILFRHWPDPVFENGWPL